MIYIFKGRNSQLVIILELPPLTIDNFNNSHITMRMDKKIF